MIEKNNIMFGDEPVYPLNPCVRCRLYEDNIINITIRLIKIWYDWFRFP